VRRPPIFRQGQRVRVPGGTGQITWTKPPNDALKGCYLVAFDGPNPGTPQWMGPEHLKPLKEEK